MERLTWLLEGIASGGPAVLAGFLALGYGVACTWLIGCRSWLPAVAAGTPVGIALLGIGAQVLGMLGIGAPIGVHALVGLGLAALAGLAHARWSTADGTPWRPPDRIIWFGAAIGVAVTIAVWAAGIGDHALPPQANDDIWHGYLLERLTHMPIITADTVAPTQADSPEPVLFYQYGLHLLWAVAHAMTGISVAEVMNGGWIVQVALLLPLGAAALAWSLFPRRPWVAFWAGALAPGVAVVPYLTNGLLPYTASLAMIPGFLAVLLPHLRGELRMPAAVPALAAVGIFVTHPSGAILGALVAALIAIEALLTAPSRAALRGALRRLITTAAIAAVVALPWLLAAGDRGLGDLGGSAEIPDVFGAMWLVATLDTPWTSAQPILGLLVLVGVVATVFLRRGIGLTVAWLVLAVLFVGTVTGNAAFIGLTQAWHGQWYRIVAAMGLLVPILAGLGITTILGWIRARTPTASASRYMTLGIGAISLVVALGAAYGAAQGQSIVRDAWHASARVTHDDLDIFRELADLTGPEDQVFNNPRDGSTWMYALDGVVPMQPYIYQTPRWSWNLVNGDDLYVRDSVACARLLREGATYALVKQVTGSIGLEDYDIAGFIERHPDLFAEVARTPSAIAYRIDQPALVACTGL
ncbi:MAG TPA: DUF6541 family protein [Candidatus Limnocylindria bacterium]|nr:DUF6541 family protein [Candidatus Limnocylindria bacterium]